MIEKSQIHCRYQRAGGFTRAANKAGDQDGSVVTEFIVEACVIVLGNAL